MTRLHFLKAMLAAPLAMIGTPKPSDAASDRAEHFQKNFPSGTWTAAEVRAFSHSPLGSEIDTNVTVIADCTVD